MKCVVSYRVGVGGVVTTAPCGYSDWMKLPIDENVYAPFPVCLSLLPGVSDFWTVTNESFGLTRFVWKNFAIHRNPTNLFSFALQLHECGDVAFISNEPLPLNIEVEPYVQIGNERMVMTNWLLQGGVEYLAKDLSRDEGWWLANHPEFCEQNNEGEFFWTYDANEYYQAKVVLTDERAGNFAYSPRMTVKLSRSTARVNVYTNGLVAAIDQMDTAERIFSNQLLRSGILCKITSTCRIFDVEVPHGVIKRRISERCFEVERPIVQRLYRTEAIVLNSSDHVASEITVV